MAGRNSLATLRLAFANANRELPNQLSYAPNTLGLFSPSLAQRGSFYKPTARPSMAGRNSPIARERRRERVAIIQNRQSMQSPKHANQS